MAEHLPEGTTLWRYISYAKFRDMVNNRSIVLPTADAYVETDVNEGRFYDEYVEVIRRAIRLRAQRNDDDDDDTDVDLGDAGVTEDEEIAAICATIKASRKNSYLSCWTYHEDEQLPMWLGFAGRTRGVAIQSTVDLVYEAIESWCEDQEMPYHVEEGTITYDRRTAHLRLDMQNFDDRFHPLFSLDGGRHGFRHEREYRFAVEDSDGANGDIQTYAEERPRGNALRRRTTRRPAVSQRVHGNVINVDVNLDQLILDVRVHPRADGAFLNNVNALLQGGGHTLRAQHSRLRR